MRSKDETKKKHTKINIRNIIFFSGFIIILLYLVQFYYYYFGNYATYAKEAISDEVKDFRISNAEKIDAYEIIQENVNNDIKEEIIQEEAVLEYITKYEVNKSLSKGTIQVVQEGRQGKQQITKRRIYEQGKLVSQEQIGAKITKASIDKIVQVGGASYTSSYKVKVGDTVYVTSDRLPVMSENNEESQKLTTLEKDNELKILEIADSWYRISSKSTTGWVKSENTRYVDPNEGKEQKNTGTATSQSTSKVSSSISFDIKLNQPSGLSLEQFKKVLTDSKDVNKVFANNAEYFYYIEKQYNINGIFVAAVGIHESSWGTSKIAKDKNNLFGYGAYDSNPYNGAYSFSSYSESIDLIARVFVKYYINPKGTSIYGGETATGSYYNGPTLTGINTRYATDKNWANGVFSHMKYLYGKAN